VLDTFPERGPLLGYYGEGDPSVMDWQIKWAVEHGITMAIADPGSGEQAMLAAEGYDAGTGCNYPRAGMRDQSATRGSYDDAVRGYEQIWVNLVRTGTLPYVPVTEPGWDSRPWHGTEALVRTERTPDKFRDMLGRARVFVERHPVAGKRIVLIEARNEYGEGEVIEPHREWGFGYLDAVLAIFGGDSKPHQDLSPADLGLSGPSAR
jgi:hypothetical protein